MHQVGMLVANSQALIIKIFNHSAFDDIPISAFTKTSALNIPKSAFTKTSALNIPQSAFKTLIFACTYINLCLKRKIVHLSTKYLPKWYLIYLNKMEIPH